MVIKNLTSEQQSFKVRELTGDRRELTLYIIPNGTTDVEKVILLNPEKYEGILEIDGISKAKEAQVEIPQTSEETSTEDNKEEEVVQEIPETIEDNKEEEVVQEIEQPTEDNKEEEKAEPAPDSHKCAICGAEFASARGLNTHMNKAHAE